MTKPDDNGGKREPVYPFYGLGRCLLVGKAVAEIGGGRAPVSKSVLASHLGLGEDSASLMQQVASAKYFGIIQGRSNYALTEDGMRYFFPTDGRDHQLAGLTFL